jgi:membrane protease YdiL (CAAX protease family)
MRTKILIAALVEFLYAVGSRTWLRNQAEGIEYELILTALRIVTIIIYAAMFRHLLLQRVRRESTHSSIVLLLPGLFSLFAVPLLFYGGYPEDPATRQIFAATSSVVSVREELLYRGVIQTLLERRFRFLPALLASNFLFVVYHIGAQPMTLVGIAEISTMGLVLGILFSRTGMLIVPIAVHALYDALWSLGPLMSNSINDRYRLLFFAMGISFVVVWAMHQKDNRLGFPISRNSD